MTDNEDYNEVVGFTKYGKFVGSGVSTIVIEPRKEYIFTQKEEFKDITPVMHLTNSREKETLMNELSIVYGFKFESMTNRLLSPEQFAHINNLQDDDISEIECISEFAFFDDRRYIYYTEKFTPYQNDDKDEAFFVVAEDLIEENDLFKTGKNFNSNNMIKMFKSRMIDAMDSEEFTPHQIQLLDATLLAFKAVENMKVEYDCYMDVGVGQFMEHNGTLMCVDPVYII